MNKQVKVVIGAGSIGQAIARRVSSGKHVLLADPADLLQSKVVAAAKVLGDAGLRGQHRRGQRVVARVGACPGTGGLAPEGAGLVISSQSGHRVRALTPEEDLALATTPTEQLLNLPLIREADTDASLRAYQISKRGNALRVMAKAVRWGRRGARFNAISPASSSRHWPGMNSTGRAARATGGCWKRAQSAARARRTRSATSRRC